jgi:S-disulfanyl-L-cysteine oxidoreductase SoxD
MFGAAFAAPVLLSAAPAKALPWDIDMYRQPSLKPNEAARSPVKGTVPVGRIPFTMTTDEAEKKLQNPVPADADSLWMGERTWASNCAICHGLRADGQSRVGKLMAAPSLLDDLYKARTDGRIFGVIQNGGVNMPRYGYKFSTKQSWDAVNYLRYLQGRHPEAGKAAGK